MSLKSPKGTKNHVWVWLREDLLKAAFYEKKAGEGAGEDPGVTGRLGNVLPEL